MLKPSMHILITIKNNIALKNKMKDTLNNLDLQNLKWDAKVTQPTRNTQFCVYFATLKNIVASSKFDIESFLIDLLLSCVSKFI